jgi:hypothetical protein
MMKMSQIMEPALKHQNAYIPHQIQNHVSLQSAGEENTDNQTRRPAKEQRWRSLVNKPIAVSVETKPGGVDIQQAYVQLAVWATAHMNLLCQLLTGSASPVPADIATDTALPHLPLLIVQGSDWSFLFASRQTDGTTVRHIV